MSHDSTLEEKISLLERNVVPPARIFVKGEPTKRNKLARLIYGTSVWHNLLGRLLFQDLLDDAVRNWRTSIHKVGMDMYTEDGVSDVFDYFDMIIDAAELIGLDAVSDDIQGWEYQVRQWMHRSFHKVMREFYADSHVSNFRLILMSKYQLIEENMLMYDSDGYVHGLHFFIQLSGKLTTHLENSFLRAALAYVDNPHPYFRAATNGDDCVTTQSPLTAGSPLPSETMGFVHTDRVVQLRGSYHFSSQHFSYDQRAARPVRVPDGYTKLLANYLQSDNKESDVGILVMLPTVIAREFKALRLLLEAEAAGAA
jgi:hypothetical protein